MYDTTGEPEGPQGTVSVILRRTGLKNKVVSSRYRYPKTIAVTRYGHTESLFVNDPRYAYRGFLLKNIE